MSETKDIRRDVVNFNENLLAMYRLHLLQIKARRTAFAFGLALSLASIGCTTTPGTKTSIWPTKKMDGSTPTPSGMGNALSSTTKAVKGQFSSMGTAMSSAYGKAKTAITSPFSAAPATPDSATSASVKNSSVTPEVYVMTGQLHESKGDYPKALDSYSKALEIEPRNPSALLSAARLYDRQNERDKAISFYGKAIEAAPNNATSYAELGAIYVKAGNLNAAKEQLQKAVNLDPKSTTHRAALAGILLDLGNPDAALAELTQVHAPAMANYQMAYLHFARKNVPATQQYLTSALQLDPNLKPARDLMASIGGTQNVQQLAQQGNQWANQAQGVMQQASAISTNVQNLWQPPTQPPVPSSMPNTMAPLPNTSMPGSISLPPVPQNAQQPTQTLNR